MFRVNDNPTSRDKRIRRWLDSDPPISVIIAAVNFEWTVSRTIFILSQKTNKNLRTKFREVYGIKKYKELWNDEVSKARNLKTLPEIIGDWNSILKAFEIRNIIVHGRDGCTRNMATPHVEALLKAAKEICDYCCSLGGDIFKRLPIRKKQYSV
jgi:hypothetical protein